MGVADLWMRPVFAGWDGLQGYGGSAVVPQSRARNKSRPWRGKIHTVVPLQRLNGNLPSCRHRRSRLRRKLMKLLGEIVALKKLREVLPRRQHTMDARGDISFVVTFCHISLDTDKFSD